MTTHTRSEDTAPARQFWRVGRLAALVRGRAVALTMAALAALFLLLTIIILRDDLQPTWWDVRLTHEIQELPPAVGVPLVAISWVGFAPWNWIFITVLVLSMLWRRWYIEAVFTALAGMGGLLAEITKNLIDRPRPTPQFAHITSVLHSYSFPSGHVTVYVSLFGFLFYLAYTLLPRGLPFRYFYLAVFALLILLVGPSRVYMGQHWASDALAGYALGFAYLLTLVEAYRSWLRRAVSSENTTLMP